MAVELHTKRVVVLDKPALIAARPEDVARLAKVRPDREWHTTLSVPRSRKHENWYRGLCRVVGDGIDWHPDKLYALLKIEAGKIDHIVDTPTYGPVVVLKSATKMDEDEYRALTDFALEFIFREILPGVRRSDVIRQVEEMVGPRPS